MRLRNIPGSKDVISSSSYVVQNPAEYKGCWQNVFRNQQPIHIEVGMGKGQFLTQMALLHPEINYIGIEMYDSVLLRAVQKREKLEVNPHNLYFLRMDARTLADIGVDSQSNSGVSDGGSPVAVAVWSDFANISLQQGDNTIVFKYVGSGYSLDIGGFKLAY